MEDDESPPSMPVFLRRSLKRARKVAPPLSPAPDVAAPVGDSSFSTAINSPPGTAFLNVVGVMNSRDPAATATKYGKTAPCPIACIDLSPAFNDAAPASGSSSRGRTSESAALQSKCRRVERKIAGLKAQLQQAKGTIRDLQCALDTRCPISTPDLHARCNQLQSDNARLTQQLSTANIKAKRAQDSARARKYRANKKALKNKRVLDAARKVNARNKEAKLTKPKKARRFKKNVKPRAVARRLKAVGELLGEHFDDLLEQYDMATHKLGLAVLREEGKQALLVRKLETVPSDDCNSTWDPLQDKQLGRAVFLVDDQTISIAKYREMWKVGGGVAPTGHRVTNARDELDEQIEKLGVLLKQVGVQSKHDVDLGLQPHADDRPTVVTTVSGLLEALITTKKHRMKKNYDFMTSQEQSVELKEEEARVNDDRRKLGLLIQGDGANISSETSQVQLTFSILNEGRDVLKPDRHFCFAIMDEGEDYDALKGNLALPIRDLNALQGKHYTIDGVEYEIELFISGDWKFLRTILGVSGPNRHFFCVWCTCNKTEIADGSRTWPISRTHDHSLKFRTDASESGSDDDTHADECQLYRRDVFADCGTLRAVYTNAFQIPDLKRELLAREVHFGQKDSKSSLVSLLVDDDKHREQHDKLHNLNRLRRSAYLRQASKTAHGRSKGYERESLFPSVPFANVIPDVLHTFLRIFDALFTGLVEDCCRHGQEALNRLQVEINTTCAVKKFSFQIGDKELIKEVGDAGVAARLKKRVTWGDMDGGQKLRIVRNLTISDVLLDEEGAAVDNRQALWSHFLDIYNDLRRWGWRKGDVNPAQQFRAKCKHFFTLFVDTPTTSKVRCTDDEGNVLWTSKRKGGYFPEDFTPYCHMLCFHLPDFMERFHGNLMQFAAYALEKKNNQHQHQWFAATAHGGGRRKPGETAAHMLLRSYSQIIRRGWRVVFNPSSVVKPFACAHCSKGFIKNGWLVRHVLTVHQETDECDELVDALRSDTDVVS
jgi:hypothetical protein